jgi:mannonate dehydratase
MPVAEDVGLKIAMHPDDPIVPSLGGIARPFRSLAAFERAREIAGSPLFGVTFCLGNWALMGADEMAAGLESFGKSDQLHYVHFQAVRGVPERFEEIFFDQSEVFPSVIETLHRMNYDGVLVPAHPPSMGSDQGHWEDPWKRDLLGLTHSVGYLQGLVRGLCGPSHDQ